jgi:hypothetical protein
MLVTYEEDNEAGVTPGTYAEYIYPMALVKTTLVEGQVRCWNRAGYSDWISTGQIEMDGDDEAPGKVEIFYGECYGHNSYTAGKVWMSLTLRWKPRPVSEGVKSYSIDYKDPVGDWRDGWDTVPHHCLLNTDLPRNSLVRQFHTVMGRSLDNSNGQDSLQFRITAIDRDDKPSPVSDIITVNWELFWLP